MIQKAIEAFDDFLIRMVDIERPCKICQET
jgi:hypothetical protein